VVAAAVAVLGLVGTACEPAPSGPTADYRFQDTFSSSVGSAPPVGTQCFGCTTADGNFQTEVVAGVTRRVWRFSQDAGIAMGPATPTVSSTVYSMAVLFRFDTVSGFRRLFDMKSGYDDSGLYVRDGALTFDPRAVGTAAPIVANSYAHVVLTRDSAKTVVGYVNGAEQFRFTDTAFEAAVTSTEDGEPLGWFMDNGDEASSGSVARIRLWNRALSASEVSNLSRLS
jgi:hypothetical protein